MKVLGDNILGVRIKEKKTGAIRGFDTKTESLKIKVKYVGKDVKSDISPDSIVYIFKYAGSDIEIEGEEFVVFKEKDIIAII